MEIKLWVVMGVLSIILTVLGFFLKSWFSQVMDKLDNMENKMGAYGETKAVHSEQIKNLYKELTAMHVRLNNHGDRIRTLEMNNHESS